MAIGCTPALTKEEFIDIKDTSIKDFLVDPPNQHKGSYSLSFKLTTIPEAYPEPTLNGLRIIFKNIQEVQLFRNGYYELRVDRSLVYVKHELEGVFLHARGVIEFTVNYFRALNYLIEKCGIETNLVAFLNLYNVNRIKLKSKFIHPGSNAGYFPEKRIEKTDHLLIPPKQIISFDNPDSIAKSFLEKIWNAFGFEEVPYFRDDKYSPDDK